MNLYLIEKVLKFKYLSNFINKSSRTLSFYVFSLKERNILKSNFKVLQISRNFVKLLLSPISAIKWNWTLLFKGSLSIVSIFEYDFNLKTIEKFLKQNIIIGGFFKNFFFSRKSFLWFFADLGKNILSPVSFRFLCLQKIVKSLYILSLQVNLILLSLLKLFSLRLLNVYFNTIN